MEIIGDIEVKNVLTGEIIDRNHNIFTNIGKQHICDWLLHDNYSDDEEPATTLDSNSGGRSISGNKFVKASNITAYSGTSNVSGKDDCLYPASTSTSTYLYLHNQGNVNNIDSDIALDADGSVIYEFTSAVNLTGMMLWCRNAYSWDRNFMIEIATSTNPRASNTGWTRQRFYFTPDTTSDAACDMIRFGTYNEPCRVVKDVKCVRIRCWYLDWSTSYARFYGIWFLEDNHYPSTPSVIALGGGNSAPTVLDTSLEDEVIRKFVLQHLSTEYNKASYVMRLYPGECEGVEFKEMGLFFNPDYSVHLGYNNGADVCTGMFARALFSTPWTKPSKECYDIIHTITLNH